MLAALGYESLDALVDAAVPDAIREHAALALAEPISETEALAQLRELAARNEVFTSLIGLGYHDTITPPVILRNVLENPAWYTAYTPYQPEISQGRLEALLNFQTMVTRPHRHGDRERVAARRGAPRRPRRWRCCTGSTRTRGDVFLVDADCHPQTIEVVRTRAEPLGIEVVVVEPSDAFDSTAASAMLLQYPGSSGRAARPARR